ncbi:transmembrane protein 214-A-like [Ruditapes philippinarum]|uniref:transmembrane protein 214-A-like n=1 Tax=Ruditapes philippinarum TaxID=129788 RepID=UPI00295BF167|nr:transmembrane protein 214-A-like [Ruditapes philippinarum]
MASAGNWSVVGKTKKAKGQNQNLTKSQRKQFIDNMPRIAPLDPMKEDSTIYDAFVIREQQRYERKQQEKFADKIEAGKESNGKSLSDGANKKKSVQKKKVDQSPKKRPFEDGIKEVAEADLKSVLLQSKGHFPDKPELWLKDLVTFLNMKLEHCPDNDKFLKKENLDYPASSLKKGCTKVLTSVLSDCNAATLEHVLYFCIMTMLEECQNGNPTHGYKIFLQLLVRGSPDIVLSKLDQYKEIVKSVQNRPEKCLALMWALGQVGYPSLRAGIRVWLEIMQPCLSPKALGSFCMQYLETILGLHGKQLEQAGGEIKLQEFFRLFDSLYIQGLPSDIRKRLIALYPQLKSVAHGKNLESSLRNFFPSYLTRANPDASKELKSELISCLVDCLSKDKHTFALWCQLYTKHLRQSRLLLVHLNDNWEKVRGCMDQKLLQQTLMTFMRTNEESSQGKNSGEWDSMTAICEELLKKMSKPRFPWRWLMFFLVSTVIAIVAYDVYTSKTLKDSKTVRFLEAYGVLGVLQKIWTTVVYYTDIIFGWLQVNVPVYYEKVYTTVAPVVAKIVETVIHFWNNTRQHRTAVADKVYSMAPEIWDEVGKYLALCWDFILEYTYWIQGHIAVCYKYVYHWVEKNIIQGDFSAANIQHTLSWSANRFQNYTLSAIEWCRQLMT